MLYVWAHAERACGSCLWLRLIRLFVSHGYSQRGCYLCCRSGTLSTVHYLTKTQQSEGDFHSNLLKSRNIIWSCRTPVWEMADSHETHFSAPLVTKARWIKPGNVSIFTWETCRMKSSLDSTLYKEVVSLFSRGLNNSLSKRNANAEPDSSWRHRFYINIRLLGNISSSIIGCLFFWAVCHDTLFYG